jgi:hypothetical protein
MRSASSQEYVRAFEDMFVSLRHHGMLAPIFIARSSVCGFDSREVTSAQEALVNPARGIYAGADTDSLGSEFRTNNCHMNPEGLQRQAALWARALLDAR